MGVIPIGDVARTGSIITTKEQFIGVCNLLKSATIISFDFETDGLDFLTAKIAGIGLATDNGLSCYIPFEHPGVSTLHEDDIVYTLKKHFESDRTLLIGHNLKFDVQFLWNLGIDIGWKFDKHLMADTMIMAWLLNENRISFKLDGLLQDYFHIKPVEFNDLVEKGKVSIFDVDINALGSYCIKDVVGCLKLYELFKPQLEAERLTDVFWRVEMRMVKVLALMERRGVYIDIDLLEDYHKRIKRDLEELKKEILQLAGREFNMNSGDQLGKILFSKPPEGFGAPIQGYTPGGKKPRKDGTLAPPKPKTDANTIRALAIGNQPWSEFCNALLRYKDLAKIESTYLRGILELIRADGKLHGSFNQTGTVTGRLSASKPNLQNQKRDASWLDKYYPGETYKIEELYSCSLKGVTEIIMPDSLEEVQRIFSSHLVEEKEENDKRYFLVHRKIRDMYYNPHGCIIAVDYGQMEMRIMAHFSNDPGLQRAFKDGVDIHTWVASKAFKVPLEKVTKDQRSRAKAVGFGVIYGKTDYGYAKDWYGHESDFIIGYDDKGREVINEVYLKKTRVFIDSFFANFGGVKEYMEFMKNYCFKYGYIRTLTGRKRRLPGIYATNEWVKARAGRQAVNTKIQGSSGDYIKMAQIKLEEILEGTGIEQVIQVHDELIFTAPSLEVADEYAPVIQEVMENVVPLNVKIVAEPVITNTWGKA